VTNGVYWNKKFEFEFTLRLPPLDCSGLLTSKTGLASTLITLPYIFEGAGQVYSYLDFFDIDNVNNPYCEPLLYCTFGVSLGIKDLTGSAITYNGNQKEQIEC
jgi:hypothetical protein